MAATKTLRMRSVGKAFRGPDGPVVVLKNLNLELEPGEVLLVTGPPGSGKSTLLSIGASLLRPTTGEVFVQSHRVSHLPEHRLASIRQQHVGFLFQDFQLVRGVSAVDNVKITLVPLGLMPTEAHRRALAALDAVDMGHRASQVVNYLSGGEQQRVAFARSLVHNPTLVFADEPTASVDQNTGNKMIQLLVEHKSRGATLIIASHDPVMINAPFVDRRLSFETIGLLVGP
ncbi:MAG: ABC transporter ATP-binding protein [Myxococcales bacterium]|nr:ABC transporter ATP-binding protein [Myxococcales bacterium]